jgi:hypothetical protein
LDVLFLVEAFRRVLVCIFPLFESLICAKQIKIYKLISDVSFSHNESDI